MIPYRPSRGFSRAKSQAACDSFFARLRITSPKGEIHAMRIQKLAVFMTILASALASACNDSSSETASASPASAPASGSTTSRVETPVQEAPEAAYQREVLKLTNEFRAT